MVSCFALGEFGDILEEAPLIFLSCLKRSFPLSAELGLKIIQPFWFKAVIVDSEYLFQLGYDFCLPIYLGMLMLRFTV